MLHEEDTFVVDGARVEAGFVDGWGEAEIAENLVDVLLPKTGRLWVTLHSTENGENMALGNRRATKMFGPPFMEGTVGPDEETLFWRWCFTKSITDVSTMNKIVFNSRDSIE